MFKMNAVRCLVLLSVALLLTAASVSAFKVSFYGGSHIAMPLQEAKISTIIRLKFRSQQESAIIFLGAGRSDYCLLRLKGGSVGFEFKVNAHVTELWSPENIKYNDLNWHEVAIHRYEENITMQIDEHFIRKQITAKAAELNLHFGVFLGGLGDFTESYLPAIENFRGCISDVFYNNVNIFKRAKERTSHVTSVGISWTCSSEFDADESKSVSFLDKESYVLFDAVSSTDQERWSLRLRTIEPLATVLFNSGPDYAALEIVEGRLRLLVGKGSNAVELISNRTISDGTWHDISFLYSPSYVEIIVDDLVQSATFANGSSNVIELDNEYFLGGMLEYKKRRATSKGLKAFNHNFKGCIRNLSVNGKITGFPHMKITHAVTPDCIWKYPCIEQEPCIFSGTCKQHGSEEFVCHCDQAYCLKADFTQPYKLFPKSSSDIEILAISPLHILEGDSLFLSAQYMTPMFDYTKLGITATDIIFNIVQHPKHGKIIMTSFSTDDKQVIQNNYFSLYDLNTDKVKYQHNGLEQFTDHLTIDMQFTSNRDQIPDILHGKHRFVLHVNISQVNDPPMLKIASSKILRITQGISKYLGPELLNAIDPDSPDTSLMYTFIAPPDSDGQHGSIEVGGKSATTFSQADLNMGKVTYVVNVQNTNDSTFELSVQVSDGMQTSPTVVLPVSVLPLQLRMINNTGLILIHKSSAIITPWNLSFVSNTEDDYLDAKFEIIQTPQFGQIQRFRTLDTSWVAVDSFTSNQVLLGQVRYIHTKDLPLHDEFKFVASYGPVKTSKYDFRITFTKLHIGIRQYDELVINGHSEIIISATNLLHQTMPLPTFAKSIIYTVVKPPKYGVIFVEGHQAYAREKDSFTQHDIDKNLIHFKTHKTCYSNFIDYFEFTVSVSECQDVHGILKIIYNPKEALSRKLTFQFKEILTVKEGQSTLLSRRNFEILFNKFESLSFNLSHHPRHGALCRIDNSNSMATNIEVFSLENLFLGDINYCHDDSESAEDAMSFLILGTGSSDFQFVCDVQALIELQNDNGPYRVVDKIFHVVTNESRVINGNDLKYVDPDKDTNSTDIVYTIQSSDNAEFYRSGIVTNTFSQTDIDSSSIVLKNVDIDYGRVSFVVSDGLHDQPGVLEVQASEPFISVRESNASIVQEGKFVHFRSNDLSVDTNLDTKSSEIEYQVLDGLNYGILKIVKRKLSTSAHPRLTNVTSTRNFTQADIDRERLVYWNTDVASMDKIKFRVTTKGVSTEGEFLIRIYPSAYWETLQISHNQTLYVEESTSVIISKNILEIVHPNISPGDITYLVTSSPLHGYLEIQSITSDDEYNCKVFDQSTINSEKMFYIQAGVNQSSDHFVFDVTNGITWLRGLLLRIVIIPENLYMKTSELVVDEGSTTKLFPSIMLPYSEYYSGKILEYKILQHPLFGTIKSGKSKVNRFTHKQLEQGYVHYIHDGSENSTDTVRLIAIARNKDSAAFDLIITIIPINDEVPKVITNTGMQMWIGGRSLIRSVNLYSEDMDSPPDSIFYIIHQVIGGQIVRHDNPFIRLLNFTQSEIESETIYFMHDSYHQGGKIKFLVTDGLHKTGEQLFSIITNSIALEAIKNENLHVFPLTRKSISPDQLQYRCSDEDREIRYVVTVPPQLGKILFEYSENGVVTEVTNFTHNDIIHGRIFYEHIHPMIELRTNDSFLFDVQSRLAQSLIDQQFSIEISVSSGGLLRFLPVSRLYLDEGGTTPLKLNLSKVVEYLETRVGIQNPEIYMEPFEPNHGSLEWEGGISNVSRIPLNAFSADKIFYKHDHSDTTEDRIPLAVYLAQGQILLCNLTIPVIINPVNDQPFYLVTQSPQMSIIEGENRTITSHELLIEDADTPPEQIIFDVISGPTLGSLVKISSDGIAQDIITYGNQFTQSDINDHRIQYIHHGSAQPTTFYFKVWDGKFKPANEIFHLRIVSVVIGPDKENELVLVPQGFDMAILKESHISVETNAMRSRLYYNITSKPKNGVLLYENKATTLFTFNQLVNHKIKYMQMDMSASNDTFQVHVGVSDTNCGVLVNVHIVVDPLIKINAISLISADQIRLTSILLLDNTTYMKLLKHNPKITITKSPDHGNIKKIIRSTGESEHFNDRDVVSFTYKELKSGIIYFVARKLPPDIPSVNDHFEYILSFKSGQPGQGFVPIEIHTARKPDPNRNGNEIDVVTATYIPMDYVLILAVVGGIILVLLSMLIFLRCRSVDALKDDPDKDFPPPLPRPPDFMGLNNNRTYSSSDGDSIPATVASTTMPVLSNIPHCKVIPIGIENDMQDSESDDINGMNMDGGGMQLPSYPFGDDNDEWSSSCDVGNEVNYTSIAQQQHIQSNPLLRRNQYWV